MTVKEYLDSNNVILVVVEKEKYLSELITVIKEIESIADKTCYVSLTQPYQALLETLKKNSINPEKFRFIDVLTNTVKEEKSTDACTYVSSPSALTEISVAFSKVSEGAKFAIVDSITTLLIYEDENSVIRFTHSLMTKTRILGQKTIFIALREDKDNNLIKDLHMFVDKVIYPGSVEGRLEEAIKEK
jgi:KaiC/GvpD/RAD55 family RecA-like ATPase